MNRTARETPAEQGRDPTDMEETILTLLETARIESDINDEIMRLVEIGERRLEALDASLPPQSSSRF